MDGLEFYAFTHDPKIAFSHVPYAADPMEVLGSIVSGFGLHFSDGADHQSRKSSWELASRDRFRVSEGVPMSGSVGMLRDFVEMYPAEDHLLLHLFETNRTLTRRMLLSREYTMYLDGDYITRVYEDRAVVFNPYTVYGSLARMCEVAQSADDLPLVTPYEKYGIEIQSPKMLTLGYGDVFYFNTSLEEACLRLGVPYLRNDKGVHIL